MLLKILGLSGKNYQKKAIKPFFSLFIFVVGIFLWPNSAYFFSLTDTEIIHLTNIERSNNELSSLRENDLLTRAAQNKAKDILASQEFEHNIGAKKFSDWIRAVNYTYSYIGENLAIDFSDSGDVIDAWMKSPLHKKNILNPEFREIGVAAIEGEFKGHKTIVVVQLFGTEQEAEASHDEFQIAGQHSKQTVLGDSDIDNTLQSPKIINKHNYNFVAIGFIFIMLGELWIVIPRRMARGKRLKTAHGKV